MIEETGVVELYVLDALADAPLLASATFVLSFTPSIASSVKLLASCPCSMAKWIAVIGIVPELGIAVEKLLDRHVNKVSKLRAYVYRALFKYVVYVFAGSICDTYRLVEAHVVLRSDART